jgi:hypothetical protein
VTAEARFPPLNALTGFAFVGAFRAFFAGGAAGFSSRSCSDPWGLSPAAVASLVLELAAGRLATFFLPFAASPGECVGTAFGGALLLARRGTGSTVRLAGVAAHGSCAPVTSTTSWGVAAAAGDSLSDGALSVLDEGSWERWLGQLFRG